MTFFYRLALFGLLPLFMLIIGVNIGVQFSENFLYGTESLEAQYGTGAVMTNPKEEVDISLLWEVWHLLLKRYINPEQLRVTPMIYGAVTGLVNAVGDPHTAFMTPKQNKEFRDSLQGDLQGIGAELTIKDGRIVVVAPLKGSPAEQAGLRAGDIIIAVDDKSIEGFPLFDVVHQIRGKKGTIVKLGIIREINASTYTIAITRGDIKVPSIEYEIKETDAGSIGYLAIHQFGDDTIIDITRTLKSAKEKNIDGLILDVRFNGGGYLDGAVSLASLFLKKGKVVSVQGRGNAMTDHYVSGRPLLPDMPLVVLINQATASAAEIIAGALRDHERATIIGMQSFGKGTVQEVIDMSGGGGLRVTVAHWLTPSGRNLGQEGVTPDIEVEFTQEDIDVDRDPQLEKALEWFTTVSH
ncbi:hypothetical protein A3D11_00675 [Candidatus Peribacteria bacterium RIFCSPHIGHO2_02_FULL_49_16]|nr:MAG: hypothetical protein A2880_00470 [Candidatus Peribacteria bacterium RIFCSPHIGHO2_01_FULL_49_38]OGJ59121.1 MAG: hypothetical protein A3D11_00675 [Candidatus Peribacteria bacterium RIFCSPHIGHO2_02_FULL_49_16]